MKIRRKICLNNQSFNFNLNFEILKVLKSVKTIATKYDTVLKLLSKNYNDGIARF